MARRLSILNEPAEELEGPRLLHRLVDCKSQHDACAIDFMKDERREQYSYLALQNSVDGLVSRIQTVLDSIPQPHLAPQHVVPVLIPQSPGLYISQLAILETGGAFCPISLDAPKERIKFVVGDVSADLVITTSEFKHVVSWDGGPHVILIEEFPNYIVGGTTKNKKPREAQPADLAYVMYTSGSSGTPKGVAVSHLAASQSLLAHEKYIPSFKRFLQFASPSFDVSVFEIFFPLKRGSTLVGCSRSQLLNDLPGTIRDLKVDAAELTPTVVGSLLQKRSNVPGLKLLLTIGEMLTRPIVNEFGGSKKKESILYAMYGPTEAAIHCTIHPKMEASANPKNIGIPFDTVSAFIARDSSSNNKDGDLEFLPIGKSGELVLGGSQLAQGYLNRPEQNKAAFLLDGDKHYYRTGDKARLLEDGTIEILGRMSAGQVKLRGQRIELGEIEEVVYKYAGIKTVSAAVLNNTLVVFALVEDHAPKPEDILITCAKWLPKFMVPSDVILLQNFPYLPSGKVDKKKLQSDYQRQQEDSQTKDAGSETTTWHVVKETLLNILGPFAANKPLAAAGLDSLVAIRVASKLRSSGFKITTVAVLQAETLSTLVDICERLACAPSEASNLLTKEKDTKPKPLAALNGYAKDVENTIACTPLQSAMLSETSVDEKAYRNWIEIELLEVNNVEQIISSLHVLTEYNAILRTGFTESSDSNGFAQIIWKSLAESQIEKVMEFTYDFDQNANQSLFHPIKFQIRPLSSSTKVLIHLHHALYDAWSLELLLDDLDIILAKRIPASRPAFATVVDGYLNGMLIPEPWRANDYWKDHLADLELRQIPNFYSGKRPPKRLAIASLRTSILTSDLETAARRLSSSPQSLFQASYAAILSSYLASSDICFGTVFSGRTLPITGIEDITGPCFSTLPIRVDISTSTTLQDLIQGINLTNRKHLEYSAVPLREIKSAAGVHPRQPLFDTLLIWQQTLHSYEHKRKHVSFVDSIDNLEFNLTLEIIPRTGNVEIRANYQESIFPKEQIIFLLQQLDQVTQRAVVEEKIALDDIFSHLNTNILSIANAQPETTLGTATLSSPVERIAAADPDRIAIDFARLINGSKTEIESMSYSQLNFHSNRIGHHLLAQGVLPNELVCICMEKCCDLYASILAISKIGVGYLPVIPDIPQDRLEHILREARVKVVIARSESRRLLKSFPGLLVIYVDEIDFPALSSKDIVSKSSPDDLSYCVFTSGSTGTPKGVLVTQRNLLSNLDVLERLYPASQDARLLQSCSQAFDVSVFEIFFTWRIGGCLCSATKDVLFRDIENAIRVLHVTHLSLTPTVAALINPKEVPGVRFLVTAGEAVTPKVFNVWADHGLYQGYGPSETTNICTVKARVARHDSINNIGPPFKNTSAFVISPGSGFSLVPRGGEGEFCFGGSQVFRGYLDQSQEVGKIIQHPTFGRLYRSGDFGRLMPDGSLAFTGRKDDQVKIRGQRVELGEINNILLRSPEVHDCITMIVYGADNSSQRLICFWTPPGTLASDLECLAPNTGTISTLYKTLESTLPSYMVPSALIPISYLPSTAQGKIGKQQLETLYKNLDFQYLEKTARSSAPLEEHTWSDLELRIAKTLAQLTETSIKEINANTSFFSLGIDSISAISFSKKLRQVIERPVDISEVLKYSSVSRLAEVLSTKSPAFQTRRRNAKGSFDFGFDTEFKKSIVERFNRAGKAIQNILPCTPLQEAMLSAAEASSKNMYCNYVTFEVNGDVERFKECWREMIRRHEILRTCFSRTDIRQYAYVQIVLKDYNLKFGFIDSMEDLSTVKASIQSRSSPGQFDPPYALDFVDLLGHTKLVLSMHHALYDGVALEILYGEIERLYHNLTLPPAVSFSPFLQTIASTKPSELDGFWHTVMKDCSTSRLQPIVPKIIQTQSKTRMHHMSAKQPLSWVEEGVKKYSTTFLAVCHAVWAGILAECLEEVDVCFGNVVSGRAIQVEGIDRLMAPCFNTIPSRLQNIHKISYLEAFRKFQSLNTESTPFQFMPLRRIQSKFSPDGSRLFDTLFILQQQSRDLDRTIWSILEDDGAMDFPLVCEVVPKPVTDTVEIILHSHASILSAEDAHALMTSFEARLTAALENPRRQLLSSVMKEHIAARVLQKDKSRFSIKDTERQAQELTVYERELRDIIADFTDSPKEKISRDVSIFRLGLDSISAVQVAAQLRNRGYSVMAGDILEHPTISQLSTYLLSDLDNSSKKGKGYNFETFDEKHRSAICSEYKLQFNQVEAIRPCTAVQQGMIAQSLHSGGQQYINTLWLELLPEVSVSDFKAAWTATVGQNEMLRTGFAQIDDPEHPFAMVTYSKVGFSMLWSEDTDENREKGEILNNLIRSPWSISVYNRSQKIMVRFIAHHALYDAQSLQMIFSDITQVLNSEALPDRPSITSLLGEILFNEAEESEADKTFWQMAENKIIVNRFPDLTPLRSSSSSNVVREISSQAFTSELEAACMENGVTMQAAAQATWARLLAAFTGESSTTFGMALSGRSVHEDANMTSFPSIVTLPVRCDISGTNAELLSRTMSSNASLHKHQFTPLTSIQRWAGYPEGRIFDTLFAYQKLPETKDKAEYPWKVVREEASVDYAVSMEVQPEKSGELSLRLSFRDDIIPVEQAELILRQYDALLSDTLHGPQNACDVVPAIGPDLLSITPAKEKLLPGKEELLHEFVEYGALRWPNKNALEFATSLEPGRIESRTWTYEQLNNEGNKVAQLLLSCRVSQGQMVAICFEKCAEASFAIIGILKAGCTYVALDPTAPVDRLKFIIEDSRANIILSAGASAQKLRGSLDSKIIALDAPDALIGCSTTSPKLERKVLPQDTAYCLYTSGTTGTPKGCLITHESVVQFMFWFQKLFAGRWTEESKWLQFASFHFDVSLVEQFWSWSVGICVVSAPRDLIFEDISGAIRQLGITHIDLTPSLARLVHPDDVPSLWNGVFITGGEQLKQDILDVWGEKGCIHNSYGPTEATIGVTTYARVPKNGKPANIGPQFDNVGSFVLKPGTEFPVLRGGIGELCVSGVLVGKGYLNRPNLTAEKFPILEAFNERVYRTGDLVRILHDGSFLFQGRADDQVKLRGQRLELNEINEVIKRSSNRVDEVVTLVLKHNTQQKEQLVTFFVPLGDDGTDNGSLISLMRDACKASLPGYMVPTNFVPIKTLPLNVNNKADSKQLATMYDDLSVDDLQGLSNSSQKNNWTNEEQRLLDIISQALHIEAAALNRGTNIFEVGLDSISIIGFSRALQNAGLKNAKLSLVKNNSNIDALVRALLSDNVQSQEVENSYIAALQAITAFSQKHMASICKELSIDSADVECIAPCTPVQEGLIYRFLDSDRPLYFNRFDFRLDDSVDIEKHLSAWNKVIARLEILRTKFVITDDGYAQVVLRSMKITWESAPIDYDVAEKSLALGTPYTLTLSSTSYGFILSFQLFHGLYDGISLDILLRKVTDEYRGLRHIDYGPSFHASLSHGPLLKAAGAEIFWKNNLKSWSANPITEKTEAQDDVVAKKTLVGVGNGIEELRKQLRVAPQAMIQAAWISVLQALTGTDLTIGIVTSGRAIDFEDAVKVIGPLFNTVPFHIRLERGTTAAALISVCHEFNMGMQEFQHTPLKDIQKWSSLMPGQSLFDTLFVFQRPDSVEDFGKGIWSQMEDTPIADYPLAFEATLFPNGDLGLVIVAQGTVITRVEASNLLNNMEATLQSLLNESGQNIIIESGAMPNGSANLANQTAFARLQTSHRTSDNGSKGLNVEWTNEAILIRSEIASLANIESERVHETSSIFELGLDSIDVIKLASRLKRQGIEIPVSTIIKCQTIAAIVPQISAKAHRSYSPGKSIEDMSHELVKYLEENGKLHGDVQAVFPATPLQQSMVNEMIRSDYERYFNLDAFELSKDVAVGKLKAAVQQVVTASPILRTSFVKVDDPRSPVSFAQIVRKNCPKSLKMNDEQSLEIFVDQFRKKAAEMAGSTGALLHVHFPTIRRVQYMIIAISHALYDGKSLQLFHEDIRRAYKGEFSGRPNSAPFLEDVFKSTTEDAKCFWKSTLQNLPPALFPRKEHPEETESTRIETKSRITFKAIEHLCRSLRITLQTLGQTCWAIVLAHLMGQLDIVFGSVLSCRDTEEANEVMFPLMNTVAVRSVLHGSLSEMLRYMQGMSDTTRQYQHFPLGTAQAYALASRKHNYSKSTILFDTLFIYQGRRTSPKSHQLYKSVYGSSEVEFPVCVEMEIIDECLIWTTACMPIARNAAETRQIMAMLENVLERIVTSPESATIVSGADGISIGGLPTFRKQDTLPKKVPSYSSNHNNEEWSDTELAIRKALHEISDVAEDMIHKDSTIFHLGLDSILVLKLPALLKVYGIKLKVSDILKYQTVYAMARSADSNTTDQQKSLDVDKILSNAMSSFDLHKALRTLNDDMANIDYAMPSTAGQLYMIRMWQRSQGILFHPTFTYNLPGKPNKEQLNRAWKELLRRHGILRTGFIELGSEVVQVVFQDYRNEVNYETGYSKKVLDLRRPAVELFVEDSTDSYTMLKLRIHHALYDGISLPILFDELKSLYQGQASRPSSSSFKAFVAQQSVATLSDSASNLSSSTSTQEKWKSYLGQDPVYPAQDTHDREPSAFQRRTEVFHQSRRISPLKKLAQDAGVSIDSLLLATTARLYAQHLHDKSPASPATQVQFGIYLANRAPFGEDLSSLAAPTLNLLPLRVQDPLTRGAANLAKAIQRDLHEISSAEMCSASLAQIYAWTGVRVDFFVNIHKDAIAAIEEEDGVLGPSQSRDKGTARKKAGVVEEFPNAEIAIPGDGRCDAYLPAIDIEMRYRGDEIDIGIFAPAAMMSVAGAESMIEGFVESWA